MKKYLILLFLLPFAAQAQYTVLKVAGKPTTASGVPILRGFNIGLLDVVIWSSPHDKLFTILVGKGSEVISPVPGLQPSDHLLREVVASATHTDLHSGDLSERSLTNSVPESLEPDDGGTSRIVFQDNNSYLFNTNLFPNMAQNYFLLMAHQTGKPDNYQRLKTVADTLFIRASDFTLGTDSTVQYILCFFDPSSVTPTDQLAYISPYLDRDREMEEIIKYTILGYGKDPAKKEQVNQRVFTDVSYILGKPNRFYFDCLFKKYWSQ